MVLANKSAQKLAIRMPTWVDPSSVSCRQNEQEASPYWVGRYMVFDPVRAKDMVTLEFPVAEVVEKHRLGEVEYTCTFRGSTLVDISPRDEAPTSYPFYLRDHLRADRAPLKTVTRFAPQRVITNW